MGLGKVMLTEQIMEYFGMNWIDDTPSKNSPPPDVLTRLPEDQADILRAMLGGLIDQYQYGQFTLNSSPKVIIKWEGRSKNCAGDAICRLILPMVNDSIKRSVQLSHECT